MVDKRHYMRLTHISLLVRKRKEGKLIEIGSHSHPNSLSAGRGLNRIEGILYIPHFITQLAFIRGKPLPSKYPN